MRGTKQANEATAKKLARELGQFRENPRSHLPAMEFSGKLRWGRTDPVTKTLSELEKIIKKKEASSNRAPLVPGPMFDAETVSRVISLEFKIMPT